MKVKGERRRDKGFAFRVLGSGLMDRSWEVVMVRKGGEDGKLRCRVAGVFVY